MHQESRQLAVPLRQQRPKQLRLGKQPRVPLLTAKEKVGEAAQATKEKVGETAHVVKEKVGEAAQATKEKVGQAGQAVKEKVSGAGQATKAKTGEGLQSAGGAAHEKGTQMRWEASKPSV